MTVDDRTRLNLHRKLDSILGSDDADTLMAHLPPVTWNEVATKSDLRALDSNLRGELRTLRAEMLGQGSELRGEIGALRAEMLGQGSELRGEIARAMQRQTRWMVTFNTALVALALTVARLVL